MTLTAKSPTLIRGYIHEKVYNRIQVGDIVKVIPTVERGTRVEGEVIGVGTRIVEFPIRLRKVPDYVIWGREVTIAIPPSNDLLLGEKVRLEPVAGLNKLFNGDSK
jgi:HlyD family secretion protein